MKSDLGKAGNKLEDLELESQGESNAFKNKQKLV